jgi:hypothetical protein
MKEHFDTSRVRDDEAHWDSLAARVASSAVSASQRENELLAFAGSARGWLAAGVLVALALGGTLLNRSSPPQQITSELNKAVEPSDLVGRSIATADAPPSIGQLLLEPRDSARRGAR